MALMSVLVGGSGWQLQGHSVLEYPFPAHAHTHTQHGLAGC